MLVNLNYFSILQNLALLILFYSAHSISIEDSQRATKYGVLEVSKAQEKVLREERKIFRPSH